MAGPIWDLYRKVSHARHVLGIMTVRLSGKVLCVKRWVRLRIALAVAKMMKAVQRDSHVGPV